MLEKDVKEVLITNEQINEACKKLGKQISSDFEGKKPLFVGLLNGCVNFMSNLLINVDLYCDISFIKVSSYEGTSSTGKIKMKSDLNEEITGRDIILVDDIIDTGLTLYRLKHYLLQRGANSVKVATLLDKKEKRQQDINPDYCCFVIPNVFVIGYGLDYNEQYRNLPYVGVLKEEIYNK